MACNCGGIRKDAPRCPKGYNRDDKTGQCLDKDGNPYSRMTTDAGTSRPVRHKTDEDGNTLHNVERFKGRGEDIEFEEKEKKKSKYDIPEEQAKAIKQNMKKVRAYLQRLARDKKFAPILLPLTTYYIAYDFCVQKSAEYNAKAKTEEQKKIAETYSKTMDGILEQVPEINLDSVSPEKAKKVIEETEQKFASKMNQLREQAKKKGKGSVEYAQFRAYADFMKMCQTKRAMVEIRLKRQGGTTLEEARNRFKGNA